MAKTRRPPARPRAKDPSRGPWPLVLVVVGIIAVLALAAVIATGLDEGDSDAIETGEGVAQTRPVEVDGAPLPPLEGDDAAVGSEAPIVRGAAFDGDPVEVGATGTPQVLIFLAHWCPHCQAEVPRIVDWLAESGMPEGVELRGIATSTDRSLPNFPPSSWLEREDWPIVTLADSDENDAAAAFGVSGFPFFVAINAEGEVVERASGEIGRDRFESLIDAARG